LPKGAITFKAVALLDQYQDHRQRLQASWVMGSGAVEPFLPCATYPHKSRGIRRWSGTAIPKLFKEDCIYASGSALDDSSSLEGIRKRRIAWPGRRDQQVIQPDAFRSVYRRSGCGDIEFNPEYALAL
jgi:hypothetical protein